MLRHLGKALHSIRCGQYKHGTDTSLHPTASDFAHVSERHRHRWEFNNAYLEPFAKAGMVATGVNPLSKLVEIMEIPAHKWFVGVQLHPELKSTVENPHPLFVAFVRACVQPITNHQSPVTT